MKFYTGLHQPNQAAHVARAFISVNRVRGRVKPVPGRWIMDSGAFTELATYGRYRHGVEQYAAEVNRLAALNPGLEAVVSQDFMCEAFMLEKTGLSVADHQRLTIERFDELQRLIRSVPLMPVLQGYTPGEYVDHLRQYGERLTPGMLVGVGSVCKRNGNPAAVEEVLTAIHRARPDLRLHGFGLKTTALASDLVRRCLYSADSMAWSFAARKQGRDGNAWQEASRFERTIETMPVQGWLFGIS